ncbi:MAG: abortive infection protein [Cenarchaeum symbiont of Oopsacas minuta]|nr:abortive infection protein [Cenarchaeum symbiont of Oopsacas minuta]
MNESDELINYGQMGIGMFYCLENSKRHFNDAKILYDQKKFQSAIPIFIICIDECFKTIELAMKLRKRQSISKDEWGKLQDHNHKLYYVNEWSIGYLDKMSKEDRELSKKRLNVQNINIAKKLIENYKLEKSITANLQRLKERCLYQNWDRENKMWDDFTDLKIKHKWDLAYYIMEEASLNLSKMHYSIEHAINVMRRSGGKITKSPYPTYTEYREVKNCETKIFDSQSIDDEQKYHRGRNIMLGFIRYRVINAVDAISTNNIIKKCISIIRKKNIDEQYSHPLIKTITLGMIKATDNPDGYYWGVSGDADQTNSKEPMTVVIATIKKEDKQLTIEKISINGNKHYTTDKIIDQILDSEKIIDKYPGMEISMENTHQAFANIGFKIHKATTKEIESALIKCNEMIKTGEIESALSTFKNTIDFEEKRNIIEKIKNAKIENWDELEANIRLLICTLGIPSDLDPKTILMSSHVDSIKKFKVRGILYSVLKMLSESIVKDETSIKSDQS